MSRFGTYEAKGDEGGGCVEGAGATCTDWKSTNVKVEVVEMVTKKKKSKGNTNIHDGQAWSPLRSTTVKRNDTDHKKRKEKKVWSPDWE